MDAIAGSPTAPTARNTRTCTRRTSRTIARCAAATSRTRTRRRCANTWRCTARARRPTAPVTIRTIRTTTATATRRHRVRRRQRLRLRLAARLTSSRDTPISATRRSTTACWVRCRSTIRPTCPSGTSAKVRPACPLHRPPNTRPSDQWPTYIIQPHRQWLIDAQPPELKSAAQLNSTIHFVFDPAPLFKKLLFRNHLPYSKNFQRAKKQKRFGAFRVCVWASFLMTKHPSQHNDSYFWKIRRE